MPITQVPKLGAVGVIYDQPPEELPESAFSDVRNARFRERAQDKLLFIPVVVRVGYEISNLWRESDGAQLWFPIPGADLRAPVTWSVLPGRA